MAGFVGGAMLNMNPLSGELNLKSEGPNKNI